MWYDFILLTALLDDGDFTSRLDSVENFRDSIFMVNWDSEIHFDEILRDSNVFYELASSSHPGNGNNRSRQFLEH